MYERARRTLAVAATCLLALVPGPARAQASPFLPDTVLTPSTTPRIVHLSAPGSPVVALRLSVPFHESPAEAGAGRLLQILARERARARATAVGARVDATRTPWGIAYTVVGSAADLDYLGYLVREAASEPVEDYITFDRVKADLMEEVRRLDETPGGRVIAALRRDATPGTPPLSGTVGSLGVIGRETVRDLWARTHRPERMTLTVAGDVAEEVLLASLQGIGATGDAPGEPPAGAEPRSDRNRVQVLRHWYGEAHTVVDGDDPRAAVAAVLVAERLREVDPDFEVEVQLWQSDGRRVLAVMGAAYPRRAGAMRQGIRGALAGTAESLDPADVAGAVAAVRREILVEARTPAGRAELVGRHMDAGGDPAAARDYLDDLEAVTPDGIRTFLRELAARTPSRAEVRP